MPKDPRAHVPAIWAFCSFGRPTPDCRAPDRPEVNVTNATLVKVPFDLERWQRSPPRSTRTACPSRTRRPDAMALQGPPEGLDRPAPGRRRPPPRLPLAGQEPDDLDSARRRRRHRLPSRRAGRASRGRATARAPAGRLRRGLVAVAGARLLPSRGEAGHDPRRLAPRRFFEQHCQLFHHRPFIWHIWDGRKDGFSCLVNYHRLDHKLLENLTYTYLGDWINRPGRRRPKRQAGADLRLAAAQELQEKLKLILDGEPPYDIFVRWKPLAEQPIGWDPDLNDGVRLNIRPFVEAGVLRKNPNIKWTKDRGKEPERHKDEYPWFWNGRHSR